MNQDVDDSARLRRCRSFQFRQIRERHMIREFPAPFNSRDFPFVAFHSAKEAKRHATLTKRKATFERAAAPGLAIHPSDSVKQFRGLENRP